MLNDIACNRLVALWFAAAIVVASVVATGVNVGVSTPALLLMLSLMPPATIFVLWSATAPQTVANMLYATNKGTEGRS